MDNNELTEYIYETDEDDELLVRIEVDVKRKRGKYRIYIPNVDVDHLSQLAKEIDDEVNIKAFIDDIRDTYNEIAVTCYCDKVYPKEVCKLDESGDYLCPECAKAAEVDIEPNV